MLDCEKQAMKGLSNEQLIYIIELLLHNQESIRAICSEVSKKNICVLMKLFSVLLRDSMIRLLLMAELYPHILI